MARIQLDSEGLVWVLIPVLLITLISAVARQALNQLALLKNGPAAATGMPEMIQTFSQVYTSSVTGSSRMARQAAKILSPSGVLVRRRFFQGDGGKLSYPPPPPGDGAGAGMPQVDPTSMLGGMKYRFVSLMMDGGLAYVISYLFAECVVAQVPFSLPTSFKPILQRGIAVQDLDPDFISPLSWYFVVLFSSASFTHLFNYTTAFISANGPSILETMNPMMAAGMSTPSFGAPDAAKQFQAESDHWRLLRSEPLLDGIEALALAAMN